VTVVTPKTLNTKVLVKWKNSWPQDATWEFYYDLLKKFLAFNPWGQWLFKGGIWYWLFC
jgi:hypothetical protein